jgi:hypothetical protein
MEGHFNRDWSSLIANCYGVKLAIIKIKHITVLAGLQVWATRGKDSSRYIFISHRFAP